MIQAGTPTNPHLLAIDDFRGACLVHHHMPRRSYRLTYDTQVCPRDIPTPDFRSQAYPPLSTIHCTLYTVQTRTHFFNFFLCATPTPFLAIQRPNGLNGQSVPMLSVGATPPPCLGVFFSSSYGTISPSLLPRPLGEVPHSQATLLGAATARFLQDPEGSGPVRALGGWHFNPMLAHMSAAPLRCPPLTIFLFACDGLGKASICRIPSLGDLVYFLSIACPGNVAPPVADLLKLLL
jgi:hypothetical protein